MQRPLPHGRGSEGGGGRAVFFRNEAKVCGFGWFEKTNPMQNGRRGTKSAAGRPRDKWPRMAAVRWKTDSLLGFQTAVGRRFEHLAEKRDWRASRFKHNVRLCGARGNRSRGNGQVPRFQHNTRRKYFRKICDPPSRLGSEALVANGSGSVSEGVAELEVSTKWALIRGTETTKRRPDHPSAVAAYRGRASKSSWSFAQWQRGRHLS